LLTLPPAPPIDTAHDHSKNATAAETA